MQDIELSSNLQPVRPGEDPVMGEGLGVTSESPLVGTPSRRLPEPFRDDSTVEPRLTPTEAAARALEPLRLRGEARQELQSIRANTGLTDALGAAAKQWDTTLLLNKLSEGFESGPEDPNFSIQASLAAVQTPLTSEEREWLYKKAPKNQEDFDTLIQTLKDQRELAKLSSVYPKSSLGIMLMDPVYLAGGGIVGAAARALRLGRVLQGAAVGAGEVGMVYLAENLRPTDELEYVLAAVLGTGFGMTIKPLPPRTGEWWAGIKSKFSSDGVTLTETERTALFNHLNDVGQYIPTQKIHYTEVSPGQFEARPTARVIYDTEAGIRDVAAVRREWERALNAHDRGEIRYSPEPPQAGSYIRHGQRSTDPREVPYEKSAERYLRDIIADTNIPELVRESAKQVLNSAQGALRRVGLTFGAKLSRRTLGVYTQPTHEIRIKAKHSTLHQPGTDTASTVVHEALHAITAWKHRVGLADIKEGKDTALARLTKEFDTLFRQARKAAKEDGVFEIDPKTGEYKLGWGVRYAFENPRELMAQLFTGDPSVHRYLNTLKGDRIASLRGSNRSMAGRMFDVLRRLLGLDAEDATALTRGLELTQAFMDLPMELKYAYKNGSIVHEARVISPESIARETAVDAQAMFDVGVQADLAVAKATGETWQKRWGKKISWNLFKTVEKIDPEFARTWLSDPLRSNAGDNITATRRAVRADFMDYQVKYFEAVREYMAAHGITAWYDFFRLRTVRELQQKMELELRNKLAEWDNLSYQGREIPVEDTPIYKVAAAYDATMRRAAELGVRDGILPQEILGRRGYFRRRFDGSKVVALEQRIAEHFGGGEKGLRQAKEYLADALTHAFRGMDHIPFKDRRVYAKAILDRAVRQDELQDLTFRGHMGLEIIAATRDMLSRAGVPNREIRRVLDLLEGKVKDAGKQGYQKGRLDIDMTASIITPNGEAVSVAALLDSNLTLGLQNYLDDLSGRIAMARHGIPDTAALDKARQAFVAKGKTLQERQRAQDLFDNIVNATLGRPVGEVMPSILRYVQAFTQMVNLRNSGFWQVTEFAPLMMRYGALLGTGKMLREVFGSFAGMTKFFDQPENANHLGAILSRNTWNDLRWRPFIEKMDDGHAINMDTGVGGAVYAQQYVYVINGMRYIMRRQSVAAANLLLHSLEQAAVKGTKRLEEFFGRYNIDRPTLDKVRNEFQKHGWSVDKWDADVFQSIQPKLMTIIDEDVLRARLGEAPELAQFSSVGRVLATFRSFIMTSHNKVLAGNLANDGAKALALIFTYQSMLSAMMVQVASVSGGRGVIEDPREWATQAVSMMGGIGLFAEAWNIMTGNSTQFGNPFMGSVDKAIGVVGNLADGDISKALHGSINALPLVSLTPGLGAALSLAFD